MPCFWRQGQHDQDGQKQRSLVLLVDSHALMICTAKRRLHILEHCSLMPKNLPSCFGPVVSASLLHLSLYVFMLNRASESRTAGRSVPSELLHDETPPEVLPMARWTRPWPNKNNFFLFFPKHPRPLLWPLCRTSGSQVTWWHWSSQEKVKSGRRWKKWSMSSFQFPNFKASQGDLKSAGFAQCSLNCSCPHRCGAKLKREVRFLIPIDKGYDFTISTIVRMDDKTTFPVGNFVGSNDFTVWFRRQHHWGTKWDQPAPGQVVRWVYLWDGTRMIMDYNYN